MLIKIKCFELNKNFQKGEYQIASILIKMLQRIAQEHDIYFKAIFEDVLISEKPIIKDVLLLDIILTIAGSEFTSVNKGCQILYNNRPVTIVGYGREDSKKGMVMKESPHKFSHVYIYEQNSDLEIKAI